MANGNFGGGDGTENNPFLIEDALDLNAVRKGLGHHYKQMKDIDLSMMGAWEPIGMNREEYEFYEFVGSYDGNDKTITNLKIEWNNSFLGESKSGLFSIVGESGELKNVKIVNGAIIKGFVSNGILCAENKGIIKNCSTIKTKIVGNTNCGGLVGVNFGKITECFSDVTVQGVWSVGGLVGSSLEGEIFQCYSKGRVTGIQEYGNGARVGGLVGDASGMVSESYTACVVSGVEEVGGLIGSVSDFVIKRCYDLTNTEYPVIGSVISHYTQIITDCFKMNYNSDYAENISEIKAKQKKTYIDNKWDFKNIWTIKEGEEFPEFLLKRAKILCKRMKMIRFRKEQ